MKMDIQENGIFFHYDNVRNIDIKDEKITFNYIDSNGEEQSETGDIPDSIIIYKYQIQIERGLK